VGLNIDWFLGTSLGPAGNGGDLAGLNAKGPFANGRNKNGIQEIMGADFGLSKVERIKGKYALSFAQMQLDPLSQFCAALISQEENGSFGSS
jgi:hypothetical protein